MLVRPDKMVLADGIVMDVSGKDRTTRWIVSYCATDDAGAKKHGMDAMLLAGDCKGVADQLGAQAGIARIFSSCYVSRSRKSCARKKRGYFHW